MMYDVVILTDKRWLEDSETNTGQHNAFYEDDLVKQALLKLDLKTIRLAWDDADFNWSTTRSLLFRTTWDYFYRFEEFSAWLQHVSNVTLLLNSKDIIYWNIDKHYLKDLEDNGVSVAESHYIDKGSKVSLKQLHAQLGWEDTVLKPCISGTARHTYKLHSNNIAEHESVFKTLISQVDMMLQPFQKNVVTQGEVSMVMIGGAFSHAVLKKAKAGDFRVQDDFGGTVHDYKPTEDEITFAHHVIKACPEPPIYARVDMFTDNQGALAILELELVEPELWFRKNTKAADILANAIKDKLNDH